MDAELQKLVDSGKLTSAGAQTLEQLRPGTFCLHKSWGFGRVADWNLLLNQIVIDFEKKKAHPMQLQYAADNLTPIPAEHFLAKKATDLPALKIQLKENAAGVLRNILESLGGKATQGQISGWLLGDVFSEPEFKRWWEATKKLLKKEGSVLIPTKKSDPLELRSGPVDRAQELLDFLPRRDNPRNRPRPSIRSLNCTTNSRNREASSNRSWRNLSKAHSEIKNSIPGWLLSSSSPATISCSASQNFSPPNPI